MDFRLTTDFVPQGDQGAAIDALTEGLDNGVRDQVLHGVTGSGKTFTVASVIEHTNKPTLVISHNKTLAWQLYQEFKEFFGENSVHYFVSYYDFYQPEAYLPQTDTYIEKDASINEKIDKMRHAAVQSLLTRPDTIVVASVSCIYNLGSPETYQKVTMDVREGQRFTRKDFLRALVALGFSRNDFDPRYGNFRVKGPRIEIHPASGGDAILVTLEADAVQEIRIGEKRVEHTQLFPANFWTTPEDKLDIAIANIRTELDEQLKVLRATGKELEAHRLEQKTNYDLEMMQALGYTSGVENYSRHLEFRAPGSPPFTLLNYFPDDFLTVVDESHITLPQIRGMYHGDRARKQTLIDYGFRLPSAIDNRPLTFAEFDTRRGETIYMSATPGEYETETAGRAHIVEQIIRPTGLLDPEIEVRSTEHQMQNAVEELKRVREKGQRALVVTITKRLAEDIADYLAGEGFKVNYIHSDIKTLERPAIMNKLRTGAYDVVVGINLLREGLDLPEVSLVIILDADKEGFLRNETTLLQTIGRAARHIEGKAVLYADKMTASMRAAIAETTHRRIVQERYNTEHGITPEGITKRLFETPEDADDLDEEARSELASLSRRELERQMRAAAKAMDFERAAKLRDELNRME
ncbi:MAG: excinuclease ABC subunit UvrB [Candidatus Spechtbacterales bacterium]